MYRLWKKPKSGRLSRFMSEFQQSPKRGGSLVVQTGFPASLIDLFVKNRDRLKKSSSKTKRIQCQIQTAPNASLPVNKDARLEKPVARKSIRNKIKNVNLVDGGLTAEKNKPTSHKSGCVCSGGNVAFMLMAFRVLIVVVLTLNTKKKLTIGITLTAFALLLAELVAARVVTRFKHCNTDAPRQKPLASTHVENVILCEKVETFDDSKDETELIAVTENSSSKDLRVRELLLKDEKSSSKSSKLKSKIMKKLRSYSKKKKKTTVIKEEESLSDVSSLVSKNKSDIIESARDEEKSCPPLIESKGDSMNGIVVIVIVLTGLLSGKIVAIGLTLSCLYLRLGTAKNI
ncbi:hypothetical protein BRARA_B02783 [Brassica rapa]|uniref:Uncharacterized protein n=2 Tax=Brassica campestris TaxID=3711 RepID=A0A398AE39_BRACM|nr:uncharacterized protein LOC103848442 [Brassica rapa]RID75755.1 hypothetical protein BRARA_B02783 [Brassica rapa]